jgi:hypothetical protein
MLFRESVGAGLRGTGISPDAPYPNAWVRLRRIGNTFFAYRGNNGRLWTEFGRFVPDPPYPQRLLVGLSTKASRYEPQAFTVAQYADYQVSFTEPAVIPDQTVDEGNTLYLAFKAKDFDWPPQNLTFSLGTGGPSGASINPTTGEFTWTPSEADGPGTHPITVLAADNGVPPLSGAATFNVTVREVNRAPILTAVTNQTINELTTLTLTNAASDPDLPANQLTFALVSGPSGVNVDPATGVLTWTPNEAQGPGTNAVTISVTDTNPAVANAASSSVTSSFQVVVNEVNVAPALSALNDRSVNAGQVISFTASAADADLPTNTLTFSLIDAPSGASIENSSGRFDWRPTIAQADTTNLVQVHVHDDGTPGLNDTKSFTVIVNPVAPVVLKPLEYVGGRFRFEISGSVGPDYTIMVSPTLTDWMDLAVTNPPVTPFHYLDPGSTSLSNRFYRVRLGP